MELSREEYPTLLVRFTSAKLNHHSVSILTIGVICSVQATLHPSQATTVLSDRIRVINKVNADIADYMQV
jgi:hypothetical protein